MGVDYILSIHFQTKIYTHPRLVVELHLLTFGH